MCLFAAASKCDPQLALKHMGLCGTQREKEKSDLASLEVYFLSSILAEIKQVHRDAEMAEEQAARRSELVHSKPFNIRRSMLSRNDALPPQCSQSSDEGTLLVGRRSRHRFSLRRDVAGACRAGEDGGRCDAVTIFEEKQTLPHASRSTRGRA